MSAQVFAPSGHNQQIAAQEPDIVRRTANFHPSVWGDRFINYTCEDESIQAQKQGRIEELKEEVRRELAAAAGEISQQLHLIDAIQRLGVAYHFQIDIEEALKQAFEKYNSTEYDESNYDGDDLYDAALWFRLLRQEGYNVSYGVFNKFKNDLGNFKESLFSDAKGLLGFYEATHLRVHGDDILDEALEFTTAHLRSIVSQLNYPVADQVAHALKQPLHKGLPRLEARRYFSIYQADASHNKALLELAKLDFNLLQSLHKKELSSITKWWKELDFATKLPFARDRVVEGYFWIVGVYFEPKYMLARRTLTKVIAITSILDDIYDVYGTIEELKIFTEAIERWDISCMDQLPDYMKLCYQALLDVFNEIEEDMAKEGSLFRMYFAKEAMKILVKGYFDEAKWFHEKYVPTFDEYMRVALVTSGYTMLTTISYLGMGEIATKEAFDWLFNHPLIIKASESIGRLMDDMTSHQFEQERGHVASGIECYMNQYGVSEQEAQDEFAKQVINAWKDINQECLRPTAVPMPLLVRILNFTRVIDVIYKGEDGYTHVGKAMKTNIALLLIDHVDI
ncbi:probable sesquiterpene synthase [Malania oleifera]|uniref:probable sesquiterpene synthase n=1 Tax=Malania oleifera TaxID=397392 RepID=UPI0025ADD377|nr:probable sesquiterpene synthase [Malania oleifera]